MVIGKESLPSGLEPTGVVVRPQEVELHAAQFVAASSEGVQEKVRMGVDGNRHSVAGGDGRDRFVGGDQVFSVVLSPVHKRVGGQGAGLSDDRCSRVKGQTLGDLDRAGASYRIRQPPFLMRDIPVSCAILAAGTHGPRQ